jgi:hypothetical protein
MELSYLLAFPDSANGQTPPPEPFLGLKDAPYFQPVDIDLHTLGEETIEMQGKRVSVLRQRFDGQVQIVEFHFDLGDPFAAPALQARLQMELALREQYIPAQFRENGLFEEYNILLVGKVEPSPDKWIDSNALNLAKFLHSQREEFDKTEIEESLSSRVRYSKHDLTLVDWEGAVIIAPDGDFQSDIVLLKVGNYQLLRYRMLDQSVESMLERISDDFLENRKRPFRLGPTRRDIRRIIQHRLEVMVNFERTEQNLLMIGDWYTAKFYEVIQSELYLTEWKAVVRDKLDNLENIIRTIQENFSLTWSGFLENIQLAGWIILLVGYFILFFVETGNVK